MYTVYCAVIDKIGENAKNSILSESVIHIVSPISKMETYPAV